MRALAFIPLLLLCAPGLLGCGNDQNQNQGTSAITPLTPTQVCNGASDKRYLCSQGDGLTEHDVAACVAGVSADPAQRRFWECVMDLSCKNLPASCASGDSPDCLHIRCESGQSCIAGSCH